MNGRNEKHQGMKTYGGVEIQLHIFLISALDLNGQLRPLYSSGKASWIIGWRGPRAGLDAMENRKSCALCNIAVGLA
jgi:hypothetical protein